MKSEPSIFIRRVGSTLVIIAVYVDDLQILSNDDKILQEVKNELKSRFKMIDLGEVYHLLGLRILRHDGSITVDQKHYIENMLRKYQMIDCKPVLTPMETNLKLKKLGEEEEGVDIQKYKSIVGALNYVAVLTRLDIATAVGILSRFMQKLGQEYWLL